ncbi:MAG TPA: DUF3160 domain-containing protein [Atribacterota bacterium]|nr:DUF3160 domain-containing protein [Atribacterota bacterium]
MCHTIYHRLYFLIILFILFLCFSSLFRVNSCLANTENREVAQIFKNTEINLTQSALDKLQKNHFVVTPSYKDNFKDVYLECKNKNIPIFVTTDSIFHTTHIFFDYILRIIEIEELYQASEQMIDRLLRYSTQQYKKAAHPKTKEAARLNIGFFTVAKKQFDPDFSIDYQLEEIVNQELENIKRQKGLAFRELLTYVENPSIYDTPYAYEDYSQYKARGHYTRNEKFERYFKAMMWLGRIDFKLRPGKTDDAVSHGREMTRQALLMTDALMNDPVAQEQWEKIYKITTYLVGKSDDLNVYDYRELIQKLFGSDYSIDQFGNDENLDKLIELGMELKPPKILSGAADTLEGEFSSTTKGFRLMGQRFIPDSYILQEMVYQVKDNHTIMRYTGDDKPFTMEVIPNVGPARAFPRGLDIAAVLGSERALQILEEEGDTEYTYYYEQFNLLNDEFSKLNAVQWHKNIYWNWLYAFLPLLDKEDDPLPWSFIESSAWKDKLINTMLGSWTELRHDTILYAKQSYTMFTRSAPVKIEMTNGLVEPYPSVYRRLKELSKGLLVIEEKYFIHPAVKEKLEQFIALLDQLEIIAQKERKSQTLTEEEYKMIWNIGEQLTSLTDFPESLMEKISSQTDHQSALVTDVHTDINTEQVLEEGIGKPFNLFVLISEDGQEKILRGPVFSYYEFKHPMEDRLTDEKWQSMIENNQLPPLPGWIDRFFIKN